MENIFIGKRKITKEKAAALLKTEGVALRLEEAEQIVELLYFLAGILIGEAETL